DSMDHYMLQVIAAGRVEMYKGARSFCIRPRSLAAFDLAEVLDSFTTAFDVIDIVVPRRRLAPLLVHPDSLHGVTVDPTTGAGALAANYALNLLRLAPTLTPAEASI